jgi:hypothetical protein
MTPEQIADYNREQANIRQRRSRAKKKGIASGTP